MSKQAKTKIDGFEVELEIEDGVSHAYVMKGSYSASLEALDGEEQMLRMSGYGDEELQVNRRTIDKIINWATANGY